MHTVVAADAEGQPIRVVCGYCHSEHNYRGGPRVGQESRVASWGGDITSPSSSREPGEADRPARREPFPIVSERERIAPPDERGFRHGYRDDSAAGHPRGGGDHRRWRRPRSGAAGTWCCGPGNPGLQEKSWPIETFFHKIVMVRNRLRTLEQQVNAAEMPEDVKVKLQGYISGCYGSLTSFNVLFAEEDDQFKGAPESLKF